MTWTEIAVAEFATIENPYVVDVREVNEYVEGHVPSAINVALSGLTENYSDISAHETVYVICQLGGRSARACEFLSSLPEFDHVQFVNIAGGTAGWILEGNEVVSGDQPS